MTTHGLRVISIAAAAAAAATITCYWPAASSAAPAAAPPNTGARVPEAVLQSVIGGKTESFDLRAAAKMRPIVLYFFPKAYTSGCTIEARVFGQKVAAFAALGYDIVGVSADDVATLARFAKDEHASQRFVSDAKATLIDAMGIGFVYAGQTLANRVTYVIGKGGTIETVVADDVPQSNIATIEAWVRKHPVAGSGS